MRSSDRLVARLCGIVVLLSAGQVAVPLEPARAAPRDTRPNFLVIVSDDQSSANFTRELMPNVFGQLVDSGARFDRAYVATSLCCPSRAQILTGLYEHHSGVDGNDTPLERPTIVEALHGIGYKTSLAGKFLNSWPCEPRSEFDQWVCSGEGRSTYSMMNPTLNVNGEWVSFAGYTSDILADYTAGFIAGTPEEQPFFALYSPTTPHLPANDDRCSDMAVEPHRPPSYDEDTVNGRKPLYQQRGPLSPSEIKSIDGAHALMTRAVSCLDRSIATVLSSLGERADETVVFFLSDNGYLYGEHRRTAKGLAYEESARVPFVVRYPALVPAAQGFTSDALVQNIDIAPTIAELAAFHWGADGVSLVPLLERETSSVREGALLEFCQGPSYPCTPPILPFSEPFPPSYNAVVTAGAKYIEGVSGERELYDLSVDPNEMVNLAGDPSHSDLEASMASLMRSLREPVPPDTTIATGAKGEIHTRLPLFTYFSQSRFASYQCRLTQDDVPGPWKDCEQGSVAKGPLVDGDYVFEVFATDETGVADATPDSRSFSIRSTGPDVNIDAGPAKHTKDRMLSFSFSSMSPGVTFECRLILYGGDGPWEACDSSQGASFGPVDDGRWAFQARSVDVLGTLSDPPAEWPVRVDNTGPQARFLRSPAGHTRSRSASFDFRLDEPVTDEITCSLDGGEATDCTEGSFEAPNLAPGAHTLSISGADELDNPGTTNFRWTIDETAPNIRVNGPPSYFNQRTATIKLKANETLDAKDPYSCALDGLNLVTGNYLDSACADTTTIEDLEEGLHTLDVVGNDMAGNLSTIVSWTWTVDTVLPVVTIDSGPADPTDQLSAIFQFSVDDMTPVSFTCVLDGGTERRCRSGVTYRALAPGSHTFSVKPTDAAKNAGETASWSWTIVP